jgi:hypothetical protein
MRSHVAYMLALATTGASIGGQAWAHHSAAQFDSTKCVVLGGTVRTFEWKFPHSWVWLVVPTKAGGSQIWGFETPAPSQLVRIDPRWKRDALAVGEKVTVHFSPLRDGRPGGLMNSVDLPDGRFLHGAPNSFKCEEERYGPSNATRQELQAHDKPSPH